MLLRRGAFSVLPDDVLSLEACETMTGRELPPPQIVVPPFCSWFEPRVSDLGDGVVAAIRGCSVTVDDEGNLIPRPS